MALPLTRDTTYAPGSQVKSADLNDIQDQIIANNTRLNNGAGAAVILAQPLTVHAAITVDGNINGSGTTDIGARTISCATLKYSTPRRRWSRQFSSEDPAVWTPVIGAPQIVMQLHVSSASPLYCQVPVEEGDRIVNWYLQWENTDATVDGRVILGFDGGSTADTFTLTHGTSKLITTRAAVNIDVGGAHLNESMAILVDKLSGTIAADKLIIYKVGVDVIRP